MERGFMVAYRRHRSIRALQLKAARKAARLNGFKDRILCETVATKETVPKIYDHVLAETRKKTRGKVGFVLAEIMTLHLPGDVLEDSLGRGTLQG